MEEVKQINDAVLIAEVLGAIIQEKADLIWVVPFSDEIQEQVFYELYICSMKKMQKNTLLLTPVRTPERKFILDSMVASFRIEGISIPERRVQAIYARVNEKLKRPL